jgi:uncharacterized delta-60 repeat protein
MRRLILAAALAAVFGIPAGAQAAPGDLDPSFGAGGVITTQAGRDDYGRDVVVDAAGRTVVVGHSETFTVDQSSIAITRYTKAGMPDTSFGGDGLVLLNLGPALNLGPQTIDFGQAVAVDTNGRIVIVGASCPSLSECFDVLGIRLTASGQLDPSFGGGDGIAPFADAVSDVIIDPSGRIIVTGSHDGDLAVFRLTPDGALDPSFSGDGIATANFPDYDYSYGYSLALDSQGRIIVGGEAAGEDEADFAVARFLGDGTLEPSFSGDGRVATDLDSLGNLDYPRAMAIDANDRIYLVGTSFPSSPGDPWRSALARYTATGLVDATFGGDGTVFGEAFSSGNAIAIDANDRPLVAISEEGDDVLLRYQPDAALDSTFGGGDGRASVPGGIWETLTIDPWRRAVLAGSQWNGSDSDLATARFISGEPLPPSHTLTVSISGSGSVTGPGIECPGDCAATYASSAPITLLASPSPGSTFAGWSGACLSDAEACEITMTEAKDVTATFEPMSEAEKPSPISPPTSSTPPPVAIVTASAPTSSGPTKRRRCRKGFVKRKVRGKARCVKKRKTGRRPSS